MPEVAATLLIVPGLRDAVAQHWQTLLAASWPDARSVSPMGREDLSCARRVQALEEEAQAIRGPLLLVAHSGGCLTVAHWAARSRRPVRAALLAAPADFDTPLPAGYPSPNELQAGGWLPVPRQRLPFHSVLAASRNDPLCSPAAAAKLAADWGSQWCDIGAVGHLNPASGYGPWPQATELIQQLLRDSA